jgi:DNA-binding NtrC family response regulator
MRPLIPAAARGAEQMKKVLIIDDDRDLRAIVKDVLQDEGFTVVEAIDGPNGLKAFKAGLPDVVLLDLNMPYMNGMETLKELMKIDSRVPVIILTGFGDIPAAVEATKQGAYDFMVKPPEFEKLILTLARAVEKRGLELEVERANAALKSSLEQILGRSKAIKKVISQINQVASTDFSVIIQGETGTGKSVVAETIRNAGRRAAKPFVSMDIGLIPDLLVESELFGYRKGAFTGADKDKTGYLETAHHGTIFIDELENMSPHVQAKLLSFMEKKKVYPLGSTSPVDLDVRIIAATNTDIRESIGKKEFREDLYYRLGEFIIVMPPLRDRADDIPFFANKFMYDAGSDLNKQIKEINSEALARLMTYSWPGNLRELKNVVRKAALLTESDVITLEYIESLLNNECMNKCGPSSLPLKNAMKELEKKLIREALEKAGGNKTLAAEALEVSYPSLLSKIKEYNIR